MTDTRFSRRSLLISASLLPLLGANLVACSDDDSAPSEGSGDAPRNTDPSDQFLHGVASGDPLATQVILWTRLAAEGDVDLEWEIATDAEFADVVKSGSGTTTAAVDYTFKVDVDGLSPGTTYYYRFFHESGVSPTGTTKTLPEGTVSEVNFAVISCSNYPAGYFHVYQAIAEQSVDAVLHLGDYIYEYAEDGYASEDAESLGRVVAPATEILSLDDYRQRYGVYRTDASLQACHAAHPFIVVWDDHEIANDAYDGGAENHDEATEGSYADRRAAALQAYFEWLPIRPPNAETGEIYRQFQYGDLVDLLMLDTRHIGRDEPLTLTDFATADGLDLAAARAAFADEGRTILGAAQKTWLVDKLSASTTTWQVLGQQVLFARYELPAALLAVLNPDNTDPDAVSTGTAIAFSALNAKTKTEDERTDDEKAILASFLPYNPDAWDGYAADRDAVLEAAQAAGSKLLVLAGDTHNAWCSEVTGADGSVVAAELATASVSSPGLEAFLGSNTGIFETIVTGLNDDARYVNFQDRGYLQVTITAAGVTGEYRFVSTIKEATYTMLDDKATTVTVGTDLAVTVG